MNQFLKISMGLFLGAVGLAVIEGIVAAGIRFVRQPSPPPAYVGYQRPELPVYVSQVSEVPAVNHSAPGPTFVISPPQGDPPAAPAPTPPVETRAPQQLPIYISVNTNPPVHTTIGLLDPMEAIGSGFLAEPDNVVVVYPDGARRLYPRGFSFGLRSPVGPFPRGFPNRGPMGRYYSPPPMVRGSGGYHGRGGWGRH